MAYNSAVDRDRREFDGYLKAKIEEMGNMKEEISLLNDKIDKLCLSMAELNASYNKKIDDLRADMELMFERHGNIDFKNYLKLATIAVAAVQRYRQAAVRLCDVVDQLDHVDGLADAGAAEQADLAALGERTDQVDHLDAGFQQVLRRAQLVVGRGGAVDRGGQRRSTGPRSSIGVPSTSMMRPSVALPTGTVIGAPVLPTIEAAAQAVGRTQRDGAHHAVAQLLLHFQRQRRAFHLERVVHLGHRVAREFHVHDGADALNDFSLTDICLSC